MNKKERYADQNLASHWNNKFKEAMVAKAEYSKNWLIYWDAYRGEYFKNKNRPEYKSDLVSNYIFSIIETIRPLMLDNDPKFQALPRQPEGMAFSHDLQEVLMYEWDREKMNKKLYQELITCLVTGTAIFFNYWDKSDKQIKVRGINTFNIFPDPLATCVDDAEYIIYATYKHVGKLKQLFPKKAKELHGGDIKHSELVYDNNINAKVDNQVLVLEVWTKDYESINEKGTLKYPKGRVITVCPELGIVLDDKPNPYKDGKFPFVVLKDYDIPGKFWGEGEVAQLLSPQQHMNELNNAILDNAKSTANMPWIVDANSGIKQGTISSRPGLILRVNPGTRVDRLQAPNMPGYVINAVEQYKHDMEQVSGIFDTLKGNSETGVYTAQGILALQEAGQARIRLKVKLLEETLGELARLWYARMQQFWKDERWLQITKFDGTYDMKKMRKDLLKNDYDIRLLAGSTMPVNRSAMLDLMIRLAQTQMPDGQMLVDREAVAEYLPTEVRHAMVARMGEKNGAIEQQLQELGQMLQQTQAQLEQFAQQDQQEDAQTLQTIEQLIGATEQIKKQIVALEQELNMEKEQKEKEQREQEIRNQSYDEGFFDAEKSIGGGLEEEMVAEDMFSETLNPTDPTADMSMPDDMLQGLEQMSDDELALLMESNPEVLDLLK